MSKIIGFDGSRAFSGNRTGTENYSYQLLRNLAKVDRKNTYKVFLRPNSVISNFGYGSHNSHAKYFGFAQDKLFSSYGWPENFKFQVINYPFLWTQVGLSLQTFKDKLDVLFVPAHTLPLFRKPGLKTIITVHDLGSEYLPQTHQLKQRLYLSLMQKYQLKTATKLIAVSMATKQDLIDRTGIDPQKIEVVYEGYNKNLYTKLPYDRLGNSLIQYNLKSQQYYLFVGTVQPRKNMIRLIEAFAKYSSSEAKPSREVTLKTINNSKESSRLRSNNILVIVGKKGWMSDEIYALPKKLKIQDRVKFLDYVKDEDLPALYSGAIALVFPSLFEGFGLPILEAQACGSPVITSNASSIPEVAGKGAILVDPYNVEDIVSAMIRVQNKTERKRLTENGFENVKKFSWGKCARETLKVLENL